ncbi:hypothetical protein BCR36DRAFT_296911 [Piromyces finnis]|uniref:Uncharacterized protein n=1 Tax=Piromyces finnis TaxID=1754191 RepID=A0A1Y1V3T1_9FUNG|nr:hypothetical protein BCR36DRAFT_296911 [Piromyces finnis]|eukprot:ORX46581.1 hypothetical protein BCR36DRAFT_296911 [Piromyces finnis]
MTILESFPIHRCIYRNDPQALRELLKDNEIKKRIDECDNHGNTPLNLSLMLDRRNCTIILLNNKCDLLGRNSYGWNSSDEAIMTGDIDIIEKVTLLRWKEYVNIFSCSGGVLEEFTNEVPNLYMKYKLRLKSAIPIIKRLGARDVEEIYKKGSSIRFNTTVAGVDSRGIPKLIKGSISIIGKIDERSDNKKKLYQEFFPNIPQWYINNSLKSKIGVSTLYKFYFDFSDVEIKQKKNSILKKAKKTFTLQNNKTYKIELFKCKNFKIIIRKRKDEAMIGDCKSNIKTNISNVDHINSIFKKLEVLDKADDNKSESDKMVNNTNIDNDDNDESDDESDDGSIYSEDTESFIKSTSVESESVFKKYINENDPKSSLEDPVTVTKIDSILERGFDENGVKVTINDLKYLEKYAPIIIKSYFENRNNGKKTYHSFKSENINYTVSKDGRTKIYEIIDEDTNTLDWEAAYNKRYPQNSDILYEVFSGSHKEAFENDDDIKSSKLINYNKEDIISEEEYFDPSSKENLHMGRVMRIDEEVKNNHSSYKFWLSKENEFPVSISQFKSIIDFFSSIFLDQIYMDGPDKKSSIYNNFSNIFYKNFESDRRFLLKMSK